MTKELMELGVDITKFNAKEGQEQAFLQRSLKGCKERCQVENDFLHVLSLALEAEREGSVDQLQVAQRCRSTWQLCPQVRWL